ncbi:MAG TPA: PD-(D/E)XK nuclease family protein, partial [Patescibacteria group bacterium]|nr:PD-(D/E)XK nuclease family protein [Patescibacteria group bacterium]
MGYHLDDGWYPRVTKILEVKNKSGLDSFFKEMESYSAVQEVKTKSAEEGTRVHEVIQGHMTGQLSEIPSDMAHIVEAFDVFNKDHGIIFHPEFVERRIWSGFHRFAGTIDAIASIGDKFGVLDIKTSTGFFPEYNLQTAAYVLALQEVSVKCALALPRDIETRWILRIDQNRTCNLCGSK